MNEKERYDLESRISAARCELEDAKKNIAELREIMERQAESNARLIAEVLKKDEEIGQLQEELHEAKSELAKYREAEQDGRLVVLPCKVGDHVWADGREAIVVWFFGYKTERYLHAQFLDNAEYTDIPFYEIGKTVFLAREEAEAAMKEANHA